MNEQNERELFLSDLYDTYYDLMVLRLRNYLHPAADLAGITEEYVQETFLTAWEKYETLKSHRDIEGWLFKTALYKTRNALRKQWRRQKTVSSSLDKYGTDNVANPIDVLKRYLDDESYAELLKHLREVLSTAEYELFENYYLKELSQKEISEILSVPLGTVKSRLFRLHQKLKTTVKRFIGMLLLIKFPF